MSRNESVETSRSDKTHGTNTDAAVVFERVTKLYGQTFALRDVSLAIGRGEFFVLVGPSGSGKTTLLRMVNRMTEPSTGTVYVGGRSVLEYDPYQLRRRIGYVVQSIGLFPHMTVEENVAIVLRLLRWPRDKIRARVREVLNLVRLEPSEFLGRFPRQLSGGQQQRVGIARALSADPEIILMDEPFSALDPLTREELQVEIKELQLKLGKTVIFVTHDVTEALKLADRICVLNEGNLEQLGPPRDILLRPASIFVERFFGVRKLAASLRNATVGELMVTNPVTCGENQTVSEVRRLMHEKNVSSVLVVNNLNNLVGIVTHRDILTVQYEDATIGELCKRHLFTAKPSDNIVHVLNEMSVRGVNHVPVIGEREQVVGILTSDALVRFLISCFPTNTERRPKAS